MTCIIYVKTRLIILSSIVFLLASLQSVQAGQKCKYQNSQHPLHEAAINNDVASINCLLSVGIDINSIGATGETALSRAAYGRYDAFKALLANGAIFNLGSPLPLESTYTLLYDSVDGKSKTNTMHKDGLKILDVLTNDQRYFFVYFKDQPERYHNLLTKVCDRHNYKYISKDSATLKTVVKNFQTMKNYIKEGSRKNYLIMSKMSVTTGASSADCVKMLAE